VLGHLAAALVPPDARAIPAPTPDEVERFGWARPDPDPERLAARELRAIPGVGPRRSLALVRARRDARARGEGLRWEEVEGIGDGTAAAARAWLAERGATRLEPASWP